MVNRGQGCGSVGKILALKALSPEFQPHLVCGAHLQSCPPGSTGQRIRSSRSFSATQQVGGHLGFMILSQEIKYNRMLQAVVKVVKGDLPCCELTSLSGLWGVTGTKTELAA